MRVRSCTEQERGSESACGRYTRTVRVAARITFSTVRYYYGACPLVQRMHLLLLLLLYGR